MGQRTYNDCLNELDKVVAVKANIKDAIESKGVSIPSSTPFADYPDKIEAIPSGKTEETTTITPSTSQQTVYPTTGNVFSSVTVDAVTSEIDSNITASNIKKDVEILGVTGTYEGGGTTPMDTLSVDGFLPFDYTLTPEDGRGFGGIDLTFPSEKRYSINFANGIIGLDENTIEGMLPYDLFHYTPVKKVLQEDSRGNIEEVIVPISSGEDLTGFFDNSAIYQESVTYGPYNVDGWDVKVNDIILNCPLGRITGFGNPYRYPESIMCVGEFTDAKGYLKSSGHLSQITIPDGVYSVSPGIFDGHSLGEYEDLIIPDSVETINSVYVGDLAEDPNDPRSVYIADNYGDTLAPIFQTDSVYQSTITIGKGCTAIGLGALQGFTGITIYSETPPEFIEPVLIGDWTTGDYSDLFEKILGDFLGDDYLGGGIENTQIYVPQASLEDYKTAKGWSNYADNIYSIESMYLINY